MRKQVINLKIMLILCLMSFSLLQAFFSVKKAPFDPPEGFDVQTVGMVIRYGDALRIVHPESGKSLHSHKDKYYHTGSSNQQQVTCYYNEADSDSSWWIVKPEHGEDLDAVLGQIVDPAKPVRLEHAATAKNLHSHSNKPAPVTGDLQEVTGFSANGNNDDNWIFTVAGGGKWAQGSEFKLVHKPTSMYLRSQKGVDFPVVESDSRNMHQEVAACSEGYGDDSDKENEYRTWKVELLARSILGAKKAAEEVELEEPVYLNKRFGVPENYTFKMSGDDGKVSVAFGDCVRIVHQESSSYLQFIGKPYPSDDKDSNVFQIIAFNWPDYEVNGKMVSGLEHSWALAGMGWWRLISADGSKKIGQIIESGDRVTCELVDQFKKYNGFMYSDPTSDIKSPATSRQRVEISEFIDNKKNNFIWEIRGKNIKELVAQAPFSLYHTESKKYLGTKKGVTYNPGEKIPRQEIFLHNLLYMWRIKNVAEPLPDEVERLEEGGSLGDNEGTENEKEIDEEELEETKIPLNLPLGFDNNKLTNVKMSAIAVGSIEGNYTVWGIGKNNQALYSFTANNSSLGFSQLDPKIRPAKGSLAAAKKLDNFTDISVSSIGQVYGVSDGNIYAHHHDDWVMIEKPSDIVFEQVVVGTKKKVEEVPGQEVMQDVVWARSTEDQLFELVSAEWIARTEKDVAIDIGIGLDGTILAINLSNVLFQYKNEMWQEVGIDVDLAMMSVGQENQVYGVTRDGEFVQIDLSGKSITKIKGSNAKVAKGFEDISVNAAGSIVAIDYEGNLYASKKQEGVSIGEAAETVAELEKKEEKDRSNAGMKVDLKRDSEDEKEDGILENSNASSYSRRVTRVASTEKSAMYQKARQQRNTTLMSARGRTSRVRSGQISRRRMGRRATNSRPVQSRTRRGYASSSRGVSTARERQRTSRYISSGRSVSRTRAEVGAGDGLQRTASRVVSGRGRSRTRSSIADEQYKSGTSSRNMRDGKVSHSRYR